MRTPTEDGTLTLDRSRFPKVFAHPYKAGVTPDYALPRFTSHFATCPAASEFRKRKAKS